VSGDAKFIQFTNAGVQYGQFAMGSASVGNTPGTLSNEIYQQSFSMALWVRFDSTPFGGTTGANCQTLVTMRYSSGQNVQFTIASGANGGRVGFNEWVADWLNYPTHYYSSTDGVLGGPGYPLLAGQWYHVVGVWEKTGATAGFIKFYVNGFQVASLSFTGASAATFDGSYYNINFLNRSFAPDDATYCGNTSISSYQIYKGALSASEVYTLFRAGGAPFGYSLMATLSPLPKMQFFSTAGVPLVGGKLYTYAAGTTTPLATYTSQSGATANTNPIILDSRGEANVWLSSAAYKLKLTTPADVEIWTVDNVGSGDQFGTSQFLSSVSGSDTITANVASPNFTAYAAGQMFNFVAAAANTTTSVTLNLNSLGVKSVTKQGSTALAVGDIKIGQLVSVVYDGTRFQLVGAISLSAPPPIGNTTPNTGAFTTLSATSTVSGAGFTSYLASPPAIGGTAPGTGKFTTLTATSDVYSTQDASPASVVLSSYDSTSTTSAYSNLQLRRGRGTSSAPTAVASNDVLGYLNFYGYNGSGWNSTAYFQCFAESAFTAGSGLSTVRLYTTASGVTPSEACRWTSGGNYYINTTSNNLGSGNTANVGHTFESSGRATHAASAQAALVVNRLGSDGGAVSFYRGGTLVGGINVDATSTTYSTSSDYRLKMDVTPMTGALALVQRMRPVDYLWISNRQPGSGFLAHELQEVFPAAVSGMKDAADPDGNPDYQSVDYSKLVPTLVSAMQEQQAIIENLKARLVRLENV
jgi:hypothetical protein